MAVSGGDSFIVSDALQCLRELLVGRGYVIEIFDHEEGSAESLLRSLRTASLFGERVAVFVRSERQGNRQEIALRFKDALLDYFTRPSRTNLLVFEGRSWNGTQAVPKRVKTDFLLIECPEFKPWQIGDINRFIEYRAARQKLTLAPRVADNLREVCAGNLFLVERELEKLALVAQQDKIDLALVSRHVKYRGDDQSFAVCDAIIDGEREQALALAASIFSANDPATLIPFLGLLESQQRKLARLSAALRAGKNYSAALGEAGYNPRNPRNDKVIKAARLLDGERIRHHYSLLLEADLAIKGGAPDLASVAAKLIVDLCAKPSNVQQKNRSLAKVGM